MDSPKNPALVVAGMHRSGTSAMARVLSMAGAALPERVIRPGPDNPLGFWEPWEMVALSDEMLAAAGSSWDDIFVHDAGEKAWLEREAFLPRARVFIAENYGDRAFAILKDPRSSVLSRLWRAALEAENRAAVYVIMVRDPQEVAASLAARDGFPLEKGTLLWTAYMLAVERDTRDQRRVFVSYDALLRDWSGELDRIEAVLGTGLPNRAGASQDIDRFLSASHRHHVADADPSEERLHPISGAVHAWMHAASSGVAPAVSDMDRAAAQFDQLARLMSPILADQSRRGDAALKTASDALADSEARLVRQGGRVFEIEHAAAQSGHLLRLELSQAVEQASIEAEAARTTEAALKALRLEATDLNSKLGLTLADQAEALAAARRQARAEAEKQAEASLQAAMETLNNVQAEARAEADSLRAEIGEQADKSEGLEAAVADLSHRLAEAETRIVTLNARNQMLKRSLSWTLTKPVRYVETRFKRRPVAE